MTTTCKLRRSISVVPEMHQMLHSHWVRHGIDEETAFALDLVAEEIFTNMVRHNPSDRDSLSMSVDISADEVHMQWVDHNVPFFDPRRRPGVDVHQPVSKREPGGLGLHLVQSLVDRVSYAHDDGDLRVDIYKKLGA